MMLKMHGGYGGSSGRGNHRVHRRLFKMNPQEREEFELKLKNKDEKKYNEFKQWQKEHMEIIPKYKIDY